MGFGDRLMEVLDERGMTRADLCRLTGLTSGHITPYIRDPKRSPKLTTAIKIADALDISLDYLAGRATMGKVGYLNQRKRALLDCWDACSEERRDTLLATAQDFATLERFRPERNPVPSLDEK